MLILISGKQDPRYAALLAEAQTPHNGNDDDVNELLDQIIDEVSDLGLGVSATRIITDTIKSFKEEYDQDEPDEDFDNRYVEYKRQVNIVNNHNDDLEEIAGAIKRAPMMARQRSELDALVKSLYWDLPEEPTRSKYVRLYPCDICKNK